MRSQVGEVDLGNLFPKARNKPLGIGDIIPDVIASRSMKINPWIRHPRPAATVTKASSDYQFLTHAGIRKPKIIEIARLGSFPDAYQWQREAGACIGNSVPPLMMRAIANRIAVGLFQGERERELEGETYIEKLEAAWQEHLAPRESDAPTVVSLFAGCGGSSLGYSMAGFRELLAVDWDKNAAATFRLNFPDVTFWQGDIVQLSDDEALRLAGVESGQLDVLDGSPPCQGFSTAGKRQLNDPRNSLFHEYVRLLRAFRPRVFVMENVSGLVKGKMKLVFAEIMKELKASGYRVSCRLLNAMWFNVPQSRERLIWIGVREDLGKQATHPMTSERPVNVRQAFQQVPQSEYVRLAADSLTLRQMRAVKPGQRCKVHHSHHRLAWNEVSPTVDRGGGAGAYHIWHPSDDRPISLGEVKRLHFYPDAFTFHGLLSDGFERVGNSVPPLFMRAIALHIRNLLAGIEPRLVET